MQKGKINDIDLRQEVIRRIEEAKQPVSVEYVAEALKLAWTTARAILLDLSLNGELAAIKTTKSYIFIMPSDMPALRRSNRVSETLSKA